jgi:hypothetical protein
MIYAPRAPAFAGGFERCAPAARAAILRLAAIEIFGWMLPQRCAKVGAPVESGTPSAVIEPEELP